jgi:hypothetical protein
MFFYAEFWEPRSAWLRLSDGDREAYLDRIGAAVQRLNPIGVRLVRFAVNGSESSARPSSRYLLVWKVANRRSLPVLERMLRRLHWEAYFVSTAPDSGRLHLDPAPHERAAARAQVGQTASTPETALVERAVSNPAGRLRADDGWRESIPAGSCSNIQ